MRLGDVRFVGSATTPDGFPKDALPEVAFVGRSNVGKSALINAFIGRKAMARVSSRPGKTRLLNFIEITTATTPKRHLRLCDLPGYGYAKASKSARKEWGKWIEQYLTERRDLRLVVCIVDARHDPSVLDRQMFEWLSSLERRFVIVATKLDKLGRSKRASTLQKLARSLDAEVIGYSAVENIGRAELWKRVLAVV